MGEAVLRGLFCRWRDEHLRLEGAGLAHSRRGLRGQHDAAGAAGGGGGRHHVDNDSGSYWSGESEEDESDQEQTSGYGSRSGSPGSRTCSEGSAGERESATAGSGSLRGSQGLDLDLSVRGAEGGLGGGRGIGDETVLWVAETDLGGHGGVQRTLLQKRVGEFDGREVRAQRTKNEEPVGLYKICCTVQSVLGITCRITCHTHTNTHPKTSFFNAD